MKSWKLWAAAAALACGLGAQAAPRDNLVVTLSTPAPLLRGDVDVTVQVSITNTGRMPVALARWELPTERAEAPLFRITRDGQRVAYTGRLIKRAPATEADLVRIAPGATLTYSAELTATYDLSRNGTYAIEYLGKGAGEAAPLQTKAALYVWLEGRSTRTAAPAAAATAAGTGANAASITFTGNCSATRQQQLIDAVAAATTYANGAVNYFNYSRGATTRYIKWFGTPTRERWALAKTHYLAIQDAFVSKPLTLDCSCTQSYYAYVYPTDPYKIYLCNAFWSAPMLGTDSKAGTLIHEMSHFDVVAGTDDWAYGQSAAAALAISNPTNALNNADNHEYFAENTPALP